MKPLTCGFLAVLLLILNPNKIMAQNNLQPGYIVKLNGDTAKGMIDFKHWTNNPAEVIFVGSGESPMTYKPLDIKKFEVAEEVYLSAIINYDKSYTDIDQLTYSDQLKITADTVFFAGIVYRKQEPLLLQKSK